MLQISDFGRSDQDLHHRSDNYKVPGIRGDAFGIPLIFFELCGEIKFILLVLEI